MQQEPLRALSYSRVSSDRNDGKSVRDQADWARELCERKGWQLVAEHQDNDVGASKRSRGIRRGYNESKKLLTSGDIDVFIVWEGSRAARTMVEFNRLSSTLQEQGVLWQVGETLHDPSDPSDMLLLNVLAAFAEYEAEMISNRIRRGTDASFKGGVPYGSPPYGYIKCEPWQPPYWVQDPVKAAVVHRVFQESILGSGNHAIARGLQEDGIVASRGGPFNAVAVKRMLNTISYTGIRRKEVDGKDEEREGDWEPIISPGTYRDSQRAQESRRHKFPQKRNPNAGIWLLNAVLRCAVCLTSGNTTARMKRSQGVSGLSRKEIVERCIKALHKGQVVHDRRRTEGRLSTLLGHLAYAQELTLVGDGRFRWIIPQDDSRSVLTGRYLREHFPLAEALAYLAKP